MEEKNKPQNNEEITLSAIAELINVSIDKATETLGMKIDSSANELATTTQKQFLELGKKIVNIENDIQEIKVSTGEIKKTVGNIESEIIKKVDTVKHNDLTYRVEKLEKNFA